MKKLFALILTLGLLLALGAPAAAAAPVVIASSQSLEVDGKTVECEKYNIDGNNFFKLRDLAQLLNGTDSKFDVGWDADKGEAEKDVASWSVDGSELKFFEDKDKDPVMTFKIEGDDLVMSEGSVTAYLSKVSEYTTVASAE